MSDFASGIEAVDASGVQARNHRSGETYRAGIGPHSEAETVRLVMEHLAKWMPEQYARYRLGVKYPNSPRQVCDLCLGPAEAWDWACEFKLLRLLGDNGKANDNMLMHILSPFPQHRSAVTDCEKLLASGFRAKKAIIIFGYDAVEWPLELAIEAFEALVDRKVALGERVEARFSGLRHPVHQSGNVYAWEIVGSNNSRS